MNPIYTAGTTDVLGAPAGWDESQGNCEGLPVVVEEGLMYSFWMPSWRERISIFFGRPVQLCVVGSGHPPVNIQVVSWGIREKAK